MKYLNVNNEREICELSEIIKTESFSLALAHVLEFFNTNKAELMKACCLDPSCIYKYLEYKAMPTKRTLILICIVAGWPAQVSYSLLYTAGFVLNSSATDMFFDDLLQNSKKTDIYQVNKLIEEHNKSAGRIVVPLFKM